MKQEKLMNVYLSNHAVINVKLHNLHWNVKSVNFMPLHNFTETLYTTFFTQFDDVAEHLKVLGKMPMSTLKDYLKNSSIVEIEPKNFTGEEVISILSSDIAEMRKVAFEIREVAEEENDFTAIALMEEHIGFYDKQLWFLKSMVS